MRSAEVEKRDSSPRRPARSGAKDRHRRRARPLSGLQREILFRILLHFPEVIDEVAQEFDALDMPEAELNTLRREILGLTAQRPGLDAEALQQHLVKTGCAATVVGAPIAIRRHGFSCPVPRSDLRPQGMDACGQNADGR